MANFDWRDAPSDLYERYAGKGADLVGWPEWIELLKMLGEFMPESDLDRERVVRCLDAFDTFVRTAGRPPAPKPCRVFVSHQRQDVKWAERIAYLAHAQGFEYWLDVHDPLLRWANGLTLPPVVQSILIAAIIELALLNCSHVIAVQTPHSAASRWVPYEYGRAKQRMLASTQAASWFHKGVSPVNTADYLLLGVCAYKEQQVVDWLWREWHRPGRRCVAAGASAWPGPEPQPLPN